MVEQSSMKTLTDRAAEAVEAAELMFIKEMGATGCERGPDPDNRHCYPSRRR